jgi:hypothetical protein
LLSILESQGLLERDTGDSYLTAQAVDAPDDDPSHHLLGHSITYRIAMEPQQGRKVFTLQTLLDVGSDNPFSNSVGKTAGFPLHAGVATEANERAKLERLCRYITRPPISTKRLSLTRNGQPAIAGDQGVTCLQAFEQGIVVNNLAGEMGPGICHGAIIRLVFSLVEKVLWEGALGRYFDSACRIQFPLAGDAFQRVLACPGELQS